MWGIPEYPRVVNSEIACNERGYVDLHTGEGIVLLGSEHWEFEESVTLPL